MRISTGVLASAVVCVSILTAPPATAAPQCTGTAPNTTQCENPGNTQIVTSPRATFYYTGTPWWWGGAPLIIGATGI
jgi:hypothetical protein